MLYQNDRSIILCFRNQKALTDLQSNTNSMLLMIRVAHFERKKYVVSFSAAECQEIRTLGGNAMLPLDPTLKRTIRNMVFADKVNDLAQPTRFASFTRPPWICTEGQSHQPTGERHWSKMYFFLVSVTWSYTSCGARSYSTTWRKATLKKTISPSFPSLSQEASASNPIRVYP